MTDKKNHPVQVLVTKDTPTLVVNNTMLGDFKIDNPVDYLISVVWIINNEQENDIIATLSHSLSQYEIFKYDVDIELFTPENITKMREFLYFLQDLKNIHNATVSMVEVQELEIA